MKKELAKKILLTTGLALLICLGINNIIYNFHFLIEYIKMYNEYKNLNVLDRIQTLIYQGIETDIFRNVNFLILGFSNIFIYCFLIYKIWKLNIISIKYSYKDYKKKKELKKQENKNKKIKKYQEKIKKLNKE